MQMNLKTRKNIKWEWETKFKTMHNRLIQYDLFPWSYPNRLTPSYFQMLICHGLEKLINDTYTFICSNFEIYIESTVTLSLVMLVSLSDLFSFAFLFMFHPCLLYPYNKVTECLFVCLSVPKDLANRWTDRVLLNKVAFHGYQEGL